MVGAVSFQPYVSSYQYTGYSRVRAAAQNPGIQAGQSVSAAPSAGEHATPAEKAGNTESLIGARSLTAAGHGMGITGTAAVRAADPETPVEPVDAVSKVQSGTVGKTDYGIPFLRAGMDPAELAVRMRIEYAGMPKSGQDGSSESAELNLPGAKTEESAELNLPGAKTGESAELNLPGMKTGEPAEPNLPGAEADKVAEAGLPGVGTGEEQDKVTKTASEKDAPKAAGMSTGVEDTQKTASEAECQTCKKRKYQDGSDDPGVSFKTPSHIDPGQSSAAVRGHELEHVVRERARAEKEGRRVISQSVTMQTGICPECGRIYTAGGVTRTVTAADTKPKEEPKDPKWILNSAA